MIKSFLATPKGYLLATLAALTAIALYVPEAPGGWINIATAIAAAVIVDTVFALQAERKRLFPDGAVLTGLIIALVLSASVPWYLCAWTSAVAIMSKHLIRYKKRPIFNPAPVGLLVGIGLFGTGQSWWGALPMLPVWCITFLFTAGMLVTNRVNKFPLLFAFLGTYFAFLLLCANLLLGIHAPNLASSVSDAFRVPFTNSVLFLAFFMATDPPTSPAKYKDQILFGVIGAVISVIDYLMLSGLSYLLVGLLVANAWNSWRSFSLGRVAVRTS